MPFYDPKALGAVITDYLGITFLQQWTSPPLQAVASSIQTNEAAIEALSADLVTMEDTVTQCTRDLNEHQRAINGLQTELAKTKAKAKGIETDLDHKNLLTRILVEKRDSAVQMQAKTQAKLSELYAKKKALQKERKVIENVVDSDNKGPLHPSKLPDVADFRAVFKGISSVQAIFGMDDDSVKRYAVLVKWMDADMEGLDPVLNKHHLLRTKFLFARMCFPKEYPDHKPKSPSTRERETAKLLADQAAAEAAAEIAALEAAEDKKNNKSLTNKKRKPEGSPLSGTKTPSKKVLFMLRDGGMSPADMAKEFSVNQATLEDMLNDSAEEEKSAEVEKGAKDENGDDKDKTMTEVKAKANTNHDV